MVGGKAPVPAGATGARFTAIACPAMNRCYAVGSYTDGNGDVHTLVGRWDATPWSVQTAPDGAGASVSRLQSVTCAAVDDCLAAGYSSTGPSSARSLLMEHYDGTSWTTESLPKPTGSSSSELDTVECFYRLSGKSLCMAVGVADSKSLVEYFNGDTWTIQTTPNPVGSGAGANGHLASVSCPAKLFCMAVGRYSDGAGTKTFAESWNGSAWKLSRTRSTAQAGNELQSIACTDRLTCIAVGDIGSTTGAPRTLAESWTNRKWTIDSTPTPAGGPPALASVTCRSSDWCMAVGTQELGAGGPSPRHHAASEIRSSGTWAALATPTPNGELTGVSCSSSDRCTAVGFSGAGATPSSAFAERWNGTKWILQDVPEPGGASMFDGVACPTSRLCMAVGEVTGASSALIEKWDGSSWTRSPHAELRRRIHRWPLLHLVRVCDCVRGGRPDLERTDVQSFDRGVGRVLVDA